MSTATPHLQAQDAAAPYRAPTTQTTPERTTTDGATLCERIQTFCVALFHQLTELLSSIGMWTLKTTFGWFVKRSILPAVSAGDLMQEAPLVDEATPLSLHTSDGNEIEALHVSPSTSPQGKPLVLIACNPNGCLFRQWYGVITDIFKEHESNRPVHLLFFNYRQTGNSQGSASEEGLIADGEAVYAYAKDTLGISIGDIHLFGWSLGGAVATQMWSHHPEGKLFVDRSFSSLDKEIHSLFANSFLAPIAALFQLVAHDLGWQFNSQKALVDTIYQQEHSPKEIECLAKRILICNHRDDTIVPHTGSLSYSLQKTVQAKVASPKEETDPFPLCYPLEIAPTPAHLIHGLPISSFSAVLSEGEKTIKMKALLQQFFLTDEPLATISR